MTTNDEDDFIIPVPDIFERINIILGIEDDEDDMYSPFSSSI